jgi:hypothetical protein
MEHEGPRLEKRRHVEAELRLKRAILEGRRDYPGKQEDIELCARKRREPGDERLRKVIAGVGGVGVDA